MLKEKIILYVILIVVIANVALTGFVLSAKRISQPAQPGSGKITGNYIFLNKTKVFDLGKHYIINFAGLKKEFLNVQARYDFKTLIYFDYLNNGSWVGLNERDQFAAASLVKVPLAMAIYRAVETDKLSLDQKYILDELDLDGNFGDLYKKGAGVEFSVEELIDVMLSQSDNTARAALYSILRKVGEEDPLYAIYTTLGWEVEPAAILPGADQVEGLNYNKINLKLLSNMFLALYNASYLSLEHSEKILEFLSDTPFNETIPSGVPSGINVAHKIGVAGAENTFSDCGIVYVPDRHYLLCLGAENTPDQKTANKFMAEVSKAAYEYVINN